MKSINNGIVKINMEDLEKAIVGFTPDTTYNSFYLDAHIPVQAEPNVCAFKCVIEDFNCINADAIKGFFAQFDIEISIEQSKTEFIGTFENCTISECYGNSLLGDGSIKPYVEFEKAEAPNKYYRGY